MIVVNIHIYRGCEYEPQLKVIIEKQVEQKFFKFVDSDFVIYPRCPSISFLFQIERIEDKICLSQGTRHFF